MKSLLSVCLVFVCISFAFAQTPNSYSVNGTVLDSLTNVSIPFATITISKVATPKVFLKTITTDSNGLFHLMYAQKGSYLVGIYAMGKADKQIEIELGEQKRIDLGNIFVDNLSDRLKESVVTAQKPLVKIDIDKLTYDIESDPESKSNSVLEMLRKVPLVTVDGEDNIQLKGNTNFKVYINGKPSSMLASNPSQVLKGMPANSIKNIEVITDPGAKYDAEGVAGIINITTTKNVTNGYTASLGAGVSTTGSYNGNVYLAIKSNKLGFTGNYGYGDWRNPYNDSYSKRTDFVQKTELTQIGRAKGNYPNQYGNAELSYEFDSLNLLAFKFNRYSGKSKNTSELDVTLTDELKPASNYIYHREGISEGSYGGTDFGLDYQRSFHKKGMLLTTSYNFGFSPNDNSYSTDITNITNYSNQKEQSDNNASSKEHTAQIDFVNPLSQKHTIEVGAKYIYRLNESSTDMKIFDFTQAQWVPVALLNDLDYTQSVLSGYASHGFKMDKWGIKTGLRFEHTDSDVKFPQKTEQNFKTNFDNLVPSFSVSYQLSGMQTLRGGYNMRIQRPGIWYLNPYVNNNDPLNISYGNPDLGAEQSHNLNLNYSIFSPKFNINAGVFYSFTDNAIQQLTSMAGDTSKTTYNNMGTNNTIGLNVFASWTVSNALKLTINGGINHVNLDSQQAGASTTKGQFGRVFGSATYTLPKDFRISFNGGLFQRPPSLQTKHSTGHFTSFSLSKDFLEKKLSLSVSISDPFEKRKKFITTVNTDEIERISDSYFLGRSLRFNVSYRFGELKSQIKKVERGINNEDQKAGESGNGGNNS